MLCDISDPPDIEEIDYASELNFDNMSEIIKDIRSRILAIRELC